MWWFNITDYVAVAPPALAKNTETFMESSLTLLGRAVDHVVEKNNMFQLAKALGAEIGLADTEKYVVRVRNTEKSSQLINKWVLRSICSESTNNS
jgi:hypothetical protein